VHSDDDTAMMPGAVESRPGWLRRLLHRFVPAGLHDPVGLARRLVQSRDPAALFALRAAAVGPLLMPLDLLLVPFERRRYRRSEPPRRPIVIVCGCARSGTTVAAQLLLHRLPLSYFSNLTSVFPRAPLTADSLFGRPRETWGAPNLHNFYGRTSGWSGPNDALYLWDRWLGSDRSRVPEQLAPEVPAEMNSFFGAREQQTGLPALAKVNALNVCAHLVAEAMPMARFVIIQRARGPHALSLLKARMEIHGRPDVPYGLMPPGFRPGGDPVEEVCRQVLYHEEIARRQHAALGGKRVQLVQLEDLCLEPQEFVERIGREFLRVEPAAAGRRMQVEIRPAASVPDRSALLTRIEETFAGLSRAS
jgi:hypothetical protein